jgi:hypothetical protein
MPQSVMLLLQGWIPASLHELQGQHEAEPQGSGSKQSMTAFEASDVIDHKQHGKTLCYPWEFLY